ncbi:uncharacterized protein LOC142228256 [Haematobia irritans]|uniref:uncharacterized protein LOC142228256 n=1 Tax=Haematobia irritans TaxID=7368 RepID=UPI003F4F6F0E
MLQCINLGQVLIDENLEVFVLCSNCNIDIRNGMNEFIQHLEVCEGINKFLTMFKEGQQLKCDTDRGIKKTSKNNNEFFIYDYQDVELSNKEQCFIDLLDIEEELLNPKWYSDLNTDVNCTSDNSSKKQYDILVKEVTPFVQFKEPCSSNRRNKNNQHGTAPTTIVTKSVQNILAPGTSSRSGIRPINNKVVIPKRKLSAERVNNIPTQSTNSSEGLPIIISTKSNICVPYTKKSKNEEANVSGPSYKTRELVTSDPSKITNTSRIISTPGELINYPKEKETAQILNKLTNLGLQIKRTHPPVSIPKTNIPPVTDDKTLQILQKLQSKGGMKVKLIHKQQNSNKVNATLMPPPMLATKPIHIINESLKTKCNNLIIRKVK